MNPEFQFQEFVFQLLSAGLPLAGKAPLSVVRLKKASTVTTNEGLKEIVTVFLVLLCGKVHPQYRQALEIFRTLQKEKKWPFLLDFFARGLKKIPREINYFAVRNTSFEKEIAGAVKILSGNNGKLQKLRALRRVLFPEGLNLDEPGRRAKAIQKLRQLRSVQIEKLNAHPLKNPVKEMLFTSNILLTVPIHAQAEKWEVPTVLKPHIRAALKETQKYWYDHPIPLGIAAQKNEALYGLRGLEEMLRFEIARKNIPPDSRLTVALSVSTTHDALHGLVKTYFSHLLKQSEGLPHIALYIFSEQDVQKLLDQFLIPLARKYFPHPASKELRKVFGVDGEYGRHYSFLKAVAALFQVFVNPQIRATFKIDLDQIFPQKKLLEQTGLTAMQHFKTPLWGAIGRDANGKRVELGMIAGALVNHDDIRQSLFTPDVVFPQESQLSADELIFHSRLPQALSTEAEMMTRYPLEAESENPKVLQRVHVTGGTNGILMESLRKQRPFTPSIIGRAEDQAYLLSVLFARSPALRYLHQPGLIMRHDKRIFAEEAMASAAAGKRIGDYIRILLFSYYGRALPWCFEEIKATIDPFSGCFMTPLPLTVVYLRFAFEILERLNTGSAGQAPDFALLGAKRLNKLLDWLLSEEQPLKEIYRQEKAGWDLFYDLLDVAEQKLRQQDAFTEKMREKVKAIVEACSIKTG